MVQCPRCNAPDETAAHVWQCAGRGADDRWEKSITELHEWMLAMDTAPEVSEVIYAHLRSWRAGGTAVGRRYEFPGIDQALDYQAAFGWHAFFEGFLVRNWAEVQQTYYNWVGSKRTGRRWASAIIKKLWDIAWDLWEHRNGFLHKEKQTAQQLAQVEKDVRQEFHLGSSRLAPRDQPLFSKSLEEMLESSYDLQKAWVMLVQAARQRAQRRDQAAYRGERKFMQGWLSMAQGRAGLGEPRDVEE